VPSARDSNKTFFEMAGKLTRDQVADRKTKAVRFLRDVLDDPDRADEVSAESVEDYAARRRFVLSNSHCEEVSEMPPREKLEDLLSDRDALIDKLEEVRDQIDDAISEFDGEEEDDGDNEG
jgi:hypothetical protein